MFVVPVLLAAWPACDFFDRPAEKVILSVGSRKITLEDLQTQRKHMDLDPDGASKERLDVFVKRVVDYYLILEYGKQQGLSVSDEELESAVREIKKDYGEKDFQEVLLKGTIEYGEWREGLREQLLIKKISAKAFAAGPRVSGEEIKAYYDSHPEEFRRPEMVRFRQIVTRTREEADNLQKRLVQGEDMAATVAPSSKAPASAGGLEPGWFAKGDLDESIEKVVFSLPVGKVSGVVETPYGFHIFEVLGRKPEGVRGLHEAMTEIENKLRSEWLEAFYADWLQHLRKSIPVSINQELMKELELG
ncbi:MAG: peptidylprolyl cis-trans isomerase lipoprotein, PpiC-type [Deltaproteobacteria bacterium]|nr:peptidylprolyl cis-trans isomerase lipoprotein, PpiC-type [Deltaproteobacteria bacterium]